MHTKLKSILKIRILSLLLSYRYYLSTRAFNRRYKKVDSILFSNTLESKTLKKYKARWSKFGLKVETDTFLLCYNLSGKVDYNIVPENIFAVIIEPSLNKYKGKELSFIALKNIYEKWFEENTLFPKSYLHKIDDVYYDESINIIDDVEAYLKDKKISYPIICKPSLGSAGGLGVKVINNLGELKSNLNNYSNLIFQEKIEQHISLSSINPGLNTIRACLYRASDGRFKSINNSIRFGVDGSLDNLKDGGVACNIGKDGRLHHYAVKMYCEKVICHPNSKVEFSKFTVPHYQKLIEITEKISNKIPLCNLVSLDMSLDSNGNWRCIEINLNSQTIRFAQYAGVSFFGKYTDEVINKVVNIK